MPASQHVLVTPAGFIFIGPQLLQPFIKNSDLELQLGDALFQQARLDGNMRRFAFVCGHFGGPGNTQAVQLTLGAGKKVATDSHIPIKQVKSLKSAVFQPGIDFGAGVSMRLSPGMQHLTTIGFCQQFKFVATDLWPGQINVVQLLASI